MPRPPFSSPRAWALPLVMAGAGTAFVFGCAQVLGVDEQFGLLPADAVDAAQESAPIFVDASDAFAEVPDGGDPDACAPTQKRCDGVCVPKSEPKYGCAGTACSPCSLPNADSTKCTVDGLCEFGTCKLGFRACGASTAGCTTDLTLPATCGGCNNSCQPGEVCNPGGCKATCDVGLTRCGQSCIDTETSAQHCGPKGGTDDGPTCSVVCPTTANGDPECVGGACIIACRAGFAHCDGTKTGPCVQQALFYRDLDGDGWGDVGNSVFACSNAKPEGYAALAGDCHDDIKEVNPGQQAYFPVAYPAKSTGAKSYDWNCDGVEMERPGTPHFTACTEQCVGAGYAPLGSGRQGPGVNDYCGSTKRLECRATAVINPASFSAFRFSLNPLADDVSQCGVAATETGPNGCR